jgi:glyoxylase-like metal-dependent hydrolase (beta-lactamase superfamily II)
MGPMRKPYEIVDGVFIIGGGGLTGQGDCLIYLIKTSKGLVLIDAGLGEDTDQLIKNIEALGLNPNDLRTLILTHCHIDHIGGASALVKKYDLTTVAHKLDVPAIEGVKLAMTGATMYGVDYEPIKIHQILTAEKAEETLNFGDYKLTCVHIPGHTPGSICIYTDIKKTRVLFAQDVHGPLFDAFGSNAKDFVESLNRMMALNADILCEGHFGIYQPAAEVKKYIKGYAQQFSRR